MMARFSQPPSLDVATMTKHSSSGLRSESPKRTIVVSYVPLLVGESGKAMAIDDPHLHEMLSKIDEGHDGHVHACLWMAEENGVFPVFLMKDAHAIADHLLAWAEGRPADWFALCFVEKQGRYVVGLFPNVSASVERFEVAHLIVHGDMSTADGYEIIFRPLTFVSGLNHTFGRVKAMIPTTAIVGFVEPSEFDPHAPEKLSPDAIRRVGPFPVCWDSKPFAFDVSGILDGLIRAAAEVS
jgi:hypothetical protein